MSERARGNFGSFLLKGDEHYELRKTSGDRMHTGLYLGKFI